MHLHGCVGCLVLRHPHSSRDKQSDFSHRKTTSTWDRNSFLFLLWNSSNSPNGIRTVKSKMGRWNPYHQAKTGRKNQCIHPPDWLRLQAWSTLWDFLREETLQVLVLILLSQVICLYFFWGERESGVFDTLRNVNKGLLDICKLTLFCWVVSHIWDSLRSTPTCLGPVGECWILKIHN